MNPRTARFVTVLAPIAALIGVAIVNAGFHLEQRALQTLHELELADDARQWGRDDAARKVAAHEESLRRRRAHEQQLEKAWGGPAQAAWKNPDLNIAQMLEQLAKACTAPGTAIAVRVERFTDFEMTLGINQQPDHRQLAEICVCLLRYGAPHLRDVRFALGGDLVAELDQTAVDSVSDWTAVGVADTEKLLTLFKPGEMVTRSAAPEPQGWVAKLEAKMKEVSGGNDEPQLTGDARRLRDAQRAFNQALEERNQRLTSVVEKQDRAGSLSDVNTAADLETKLAMLRESDAALADVRDFFLNEEIKYRSILEQAQIDPLLLNIELRGVRERQGSRRPLLEQLLQALAERQRCAKTFVTEMQNFWGSWTKVGNLIHFSSSEAEATYSRSSTQLSQATARVSAAFRALSP